MRTTNYPCYVRMVDVRDATPVPVVFSIAGCGGFGDFSRLVSCIVCGQFFKWEISSWDPPPDGQRRLVDTAGTSTCPRCKAPLRDSIRLAPDWFRCVFGHLHNFDPIPTPLPPNSMDRGLVLHVPVLESLTGAKPDRRYIAERDG